MSTKQHWETLTGRKASAKRTRKVIGHIGVDAGLCYIGDPCYIEGVFGMPRAEGYDRFYTENLSDDRAERAWTVPYSNIPEVPGRATPVRAVVVGTGFGDGMYQVMAEIDEHGRVRRVTIDFDR